MDDTSVLRARLESPLAGFFGTNDLTDCAPVAAPLPPTNQLSTITHQLRSEVIAPPPTNNFILLPTFVFNVPSDSLSNGLLQSSTDLVTWHDRPDCYQDQTSWFVPTLPGDTFEFYRAKFELVTRPTN